MCILFRIWKIHIRRIRQYASGLEGKEKGTGQNRGYTPCHGTVAGGRKVLQERIRYRPCGLRGFRDGGCEKEIHAAPQALCRGAQIRGVERDNAGNAHHVWDRYTYGVGHMQDLRMAPQDTFQAGDKRRYGRYRAAGNKHNRQRGRLYAAYNRPYGAAGRAAWRAGRSAHSALGAFNVELQNCFPCRAGEAFCAWECEGWKIISKHCGIW